MLIARAGTGRWRGAGAAGRRTRRARVLERQVAVQGVLQVVAGSLGAFA